MPESTKARVLALRSEGWTFAAIARELGISQSTAWDHVRRPIREQGIPRAQHRCKYHDCEHPLPIAGVCWPGTGNPACVARGDRPTISPNGRAPFGWANNDGAAAPHPEQFAALLAILRDLDAGKTTSDVARARGMHYDTVYDIKRRAIPLLRQALPC